MHLPDFSDTIVALATPPGVGAIAVIRMSGVAAIPIADRLFKGKNLSEQSSHSAHFGRIVDPADDTAIDEVLLTLFRGPRSYTGEDTVEISCHGSIYLQKAVVEACVRAGARPAQAGEFTLRAFHYGKIDLTQAEAVADLIASEHQAAADVALRQLRGGFKQEISQLRAELIHFASLVELELDFAEEDVEFADRSQLRQLVTHTQGHVRELLQSFQLGNALKTGVNTVIAGRPNAGKSTLLNALLNEERAIVSDIPGTTRDTIEEKLSIKGVQFRLIDTAGIREAQDQIEAIGVQRTFAKIEEAAIVVYVWDISATTLPEVYADLKQLSSVQAQLLVVCNKMDRNPYFETNWLLQPTFDEVHPYLLEGSSPDLEVPSVLETARIIAVSAKNAMNIEYLKNQLFETIIGEEVAVDSTIVTNSRHYAALLRANESLNAVLTGLAAGITQDFIAQDIRHALRHLGEITGEIGVEDLLGSIFSSFCIGK
jgi:tRNA modification GTPase